MRFNDWPVKTKLLAGFTCMVLVVVGVSTMALHSLSEENARFEQYIGGVMHRKELAKEVESAAHSRAVAARNLVLVSDASEQGAELAAVQSQHARMQDAIRALKSAVGTNTTATSHDRQFVEAIEAVEAKYGPVALGIVQLVLDGHREEAIDRMNRDCRPLLRDLVKAASDYVAYGQEQDKRAVAASGSAFAFDRALLIVGCLSSVALAFLGGLFLSNRVTRPLTDAVRLAEAVASGDLGRDIEVKSKDETGQLLLALKQMNQCLSDMVSSIRLSAEGIATASREIASGNQDLSARTEQQASALQETASSMQQMTSAVQRNAEASRDADRSAGEAANVANAGGAVVQRMVDTMAEVSASSARIGDIIGTIDAIAFQTNILALNAAVEAARAGDAGRGFAVVASEVRGLATRSADASKEIRGLIGMSQERVQAGVTLAKDAGEAMTNVLAEVGRVTALVSKISASTAEQSSDIGQVNQAISSIDQGTQQNAALVEQSAAAAESLKLQAAQLISLMAQFRTPMRA